MPDDTSPLVHVIHDPRGCWLGQITSGATAPDDTARCTGGQDCSPIPVPLPSAADLSAMRAEHTRLVCTAGPDLCALGHRWPCQVAQLLALVEAQASEIERLSLKWSEDQGDESAWEVNAWHWRAERDDARAQLAAVLVALAGGSGSMRG